MHSNRGYSSSKISFPQTVSSTLMQSTTTITTNLPPTSTSIGIANNLNNYQIDVFSLSWVSNNNSVDFTFSVNMPSGMNNNFWAAFAFSSDQNMANNYFFKKSTSKKI